MVEVEVAFHAGYSVCHLPSSYDFDVGLCIVPDAVAEKDDVG